MPNEPRAGGRSRKKRTVLYIDMDAFFASVELASRPFPKGKPAAVCGGKAVKNAKMLKKLLEQ